MKLCLTSLLALLPVFASLAGCDGSGSPKDTVAARTLTVTPTATAAATAASSHDGSRAGAPSLAAAVAVPAVVQASVATTSLSAPGATRAASSLIVKRLVVTTGVKAREPVGGAPLLADGSPIYAFVELANPAGPSEKVRITFERKDAPEPVGNVTLPVPSGAPRHRTWAFTRFIRTPGQWDAVLWSESGVELARTGFEVGPS